MGPKNFSIFLDNPSGIYNGGSCISGQVLLTLEKPKKFRALKLRVKGRAHVSWSETEHYTENHPRHGLRQRTRSVTFSNDETYISVDLILLGNVEIPEGDTSYPFSVQLPANLPSSYDGQYGYVKYSVKAVLDRPWRIDHEVKVQFNVFTPIDLNLSLFAKEPVSITTSKTFTSLFSRGGPLQMIASIPQRGYVPGQSVPINLILNNYSSVVIKSVKIFLSEEVVFFSRFGARTRSTTTTLHTVETEGVEPDRSKPYNLEFKIPESSFINLGPCSIMKLAHELVIEACVEGLHGNLVLGIPILIGSTPIYAAAPQVWDGPAPGGAFIPPQGFSAAAPGGTFIPPQGFPPAAPGGSFIPPKGFPEEGPAVNLAPSAPPPSYDDIFESEKKFSQEKC